MNSSQVLIGLVKSNFCNEKKERENYEGGPKSFEAIARVSIIPTVTCIILLEVTTDCDICNSVVL